MGRCAFDDMFNSRRQPLSGYYFGTHFYNSEDLNYIGALSLF